MENGPFTDDVPSYKPPCIRNFPWPDLVGGLELFFPYIENFIIPTDFHIFAEGLKPPTSRWYLFPCPKPMWVGDHQLPSGISLRDHIWNLGVRRGPVAMGWKMGPKSAGQGTLAPDQNSWDLWMFMQLYMYIHKYIYIYKNSIYGGPMRTHKYVYIIRYHDL